MIIEINLDSLEAHTRYKSIDPLLLRSTQHFFQMSSMVLKAFNFAMATFIPFAIAGPDAAGVSPSDILVEPVWIATEFCDGQSLAPVTTSGVSRPTLEFYDDMGLTPSSWDTTHSLPFPWS